MERTGEQRPKGDPNGRMKAGRKWKDCILRAGGPGETLDPGPSRRGKRIGSGRGRGEREGGGEGGGRGQEGAGRVDRRGGLKLHLRWERERPFRGMTHDVSRDPPGNYGPPERCPDGAPVDPRLRESAGRGLARRPRGVDRELVERGGLAPGAL